MYTNRKARRRKRGITKKRIRNPATPDEIRDLEETLGVTITKPMGRGTYLKLKRMSAEDTFSSSEEESLRRLEFWQRVAVYTGDYSAVDLLILDETAS